MKKFIFILMIILVYSNTIIGQIQKEFNQTLVEQKKVFQFRADLIKLDSIVKNGASNEHLPTFSYDSVKSDLLEYSIDVDLNKNYHYSNINLDLKGNQKDIFSEMQKDNLIPTLDELKKNGELKIKFRSIASDIEELPQRTGNIKTDNQVYLAIIQKIFQKHQQVLKKDGLTFIIYKQWELDAKLPSELDIFIYRSAFIQFIHERYSISYAN